jgi:hypothetical protein
MNKVRISVGWPIGLLIMGLSLYGWLMNLITLWTMPLDPLTGQFIVRIIGIFIAPLGVILGYV